VLRIPGKRRPRTEQVLSALLQGRTIKEAAADVGMGYHTLRGWLKADWFRAEYEEAKRLLLDDTVNKLRDAGGEGVATLREVANDKAKPAAARVTAARALLEVLLRAVETQDKRSAFGTVGSITQIPKESRVLAEFEGSDGMRFRVKVVDCSPEAKLLAEADGILPMSPAETEQNKVPLLPVRSDNLGQELWRIDFEDGAQNMPTLVVNEIIDDRIA